MSLILGPTDKRRAVLPLDAAASLPRFATPASVPKKRRARAHGHWREVFICEEEAAATLTLADAVLQGHSILLLDLGVREECAVLLKEGISAAEEERRVKLLRRSDGAGRIFLPLLIIHRSHSLRAQ